MDNAIVEVGGKKAKLLKLDISKYAGATPDSASVTVVLYGDHYHEILCGIASKDSLTLVKISEGKLLIGNFYMRLQGVSRHSADEYKLYLTTKKAIR